VSVSDRARLTAAALVERLRRDGLVLATAESLTGGLVAAGVTAVPGASDVFRGGIVAYATDSKRDVLGVPPDVLRAHGPVAGETARAMAEAVCRLFGTDLGIATTGVAGPDPVGGLPPGVVYVAAALADGPTRVARPPCTGDRAAIRDCAVHAALEAGLALLDSGNPPRE
jgi:nicotinamide-nucleotide amidase